MLPPGQRCVLSGQGRASDYAARLLGSLGAAPLRGAGDDDEHPALRWAGSGLMSLTGAADGAPLMCPAPLAACADGALAALASLAPNGVLAGLRGSHLLTERAALAGLHRAGAVSPGGGCRLLAAADGRFAISLARDEDWGLVPAWLEHEGDADWTAVARFTRVKPVAELLERGRLLGLAIAADVACDPAPAAWYSVHARAAKPAAPASRAEPLVIDLSSLWAGPLCSHLLQKLGARVIKIESHRRPDGARFGNAAFFDLLNAGKDCVVLDLSDRLGRQQLRALLLRADIVIEGSRPRALRQLGIEAEAIIEENPGLSWISLSGYGRGEPQEHWAAFGDDAGVAAGLTDLMRRASGELVFVGDAIADPLTGLHAALAAWASYLGGGGRLVSLALSEVLRHCLQFDGAALDDAALRERQREWSALDGTALAARARTPHERAAALGADSERVLREFGL